MQGTTAVRRVGVLGLGSVGCVTAACLARGGHDVIVVDTRQERVDLVNAGRSPVPEPGLGDQLERAVAEGRLRASLRTEEAVDGAEVVVLCEPDGIERAGREIGAALRHRNEGLTVVVRSAVLPGTTQNVLLPALLAGVGLRSASTLRVAVNPEFLRPGSALQDYRRPPMTLVGCEGAATASLVRSLYEGVEAPFVHTSINTAEMAKQAANGFHGLTGCFAVEMADLCASLRADAAEVMACLGPRSEAGGSWSPEELRALLDRARRSVEAVLATARRRVGTVTPLPSWAASA